MTSQSGSNPADSAELPTRVELEFTNAFRDPVLHSRAPWFHQQFNTADVLQGYLGFNGRLPGGIPLEAVLSYDWRTRVAATEGELAAPNRRRGWGRCGLRNKGRQARPWLVRLALQKLDWLEGPSFVVPGDQDLWRARAGPEYAFVLKIQGMQERIASWDSQSGGVEVHPEAVVWE